MIYASRRLSPRGGEGDTSCRQPFPGRPGLSQPCSQRRLSGRCASTVLSRNEEDSAKWFGKRKALFFTTFAQRKTVSNLGANILTGCSPSGWPDFPLKPRGRLSVSSALVRLEEKYRRPRIARMSTDFRRGLVSSVALPRSYPCRSVISVVGLPDRGYSKEARPCFCALVEKFVSHPRSRFGC